ncbi:MAG: glycosyltransferase family 4 protein [bacterium]|nr:glycosyltransferase family 4 protein [bacterium]
MKVSLISCWFNSVYAVYADHLQQALSRLGCQAKIITTNCECGSAIKKEANALYNQKCDFFFLPTLTLYPSAKKWKNSLRLSGKRGLYFCQALRFLAKSKGMDIIHIQQTMHSFGSMAVFSLLKLARPGRVVITVQELDAFQFEFPEANRIYNRARVIMVNFEEMKQRLIDMGVKAEKIKVIPYGIQPPRLNGAVRDGAIFYGGHHLLSGKGTEDLFAALKILKEQGKRLTVKIHGQYAMDDQEAGVELARKYQVDDCILWLDRKVNIERLNSEYQRSLFCVLPFHKGTACFPAVMAMANATPVIGTRVAGLPDYIEGAGIFVDTASPVQLARAMANLMEDESLRTRLGQKSRERAVRQFNWDEVGKEVLKAYEVNG